MRLRPGTPFDGSACSGRNGQEKIVPDPRVHPLPEGTDEIMLLIVARGPAEVSG
ncbi:hypothetical protein [Streptomyces sp. NPDC001980]|uniref:hypothetical protein n=1 Tax=Streptomyces sp. NPDC001980 TaxID=3157126 RepID=UPI0033176DA2